MDLMILFALTLNGILLVLICNKLRLFVAGHLFDYNFDINKGDIYIKFMEDAITNICYNCLDKHVLSGKADTIAFYWYAYGLFHCLLLLTVNCLCKGRVSCTFYSQCVAK